MIEEMFEQFFRRYDFWRWFYRHPRNAAVRGHFVFIRTFNKEGKPMPTVLADNLISNIPVVFLNAEGAVVPMPTSTPPTVVVDNTAAGTVAIGSDNASVNFTPTQPPTPGTAINITLVATNANGSTVTVTGAFDIGTPVAPDETAVSGSFNDAAITTSPLPAA